MIQFIKRLFCKHKFVNITYKSKSRYKRHLGRYRIVYNVYNYCECSHCKTKINNYKVLSNVSAYRVNQFFNNLKS